MYLSNHIKFCLLILLLLCKATSIIGQSYTVKGKVITDHDGEAASFAIVSIQNQELRTLCDINGNFELRNIPAGKHTLGVECLGYAKLKKSIVVSKTQSIQLQLQSSSFALPEFEVMAKRSRKGKVVIDEAALEYIQPTSLADVQGFHLHTVKRIDDAQHLLIVVIVAHDLAISAQERNIDFF